MRMDEGYAGVVLSVSAPSGTGKTSLVKALLERHREIHVSVSHTTRPMRPGEEDGKHYHFVTPEAFQILIEEKRFLEHARVFDHFYGTSVDALAEPMKQGKDILLDIDWQGAFSAKKLFQKNAVSVFLLPPNRTVLESRLRGRGQDSDEVIARRIAAADSDMAHCSLYDYVVVNDVFDLALKELESILFAERCRFHRQSLRHADVFQGLNLR